MIVKLKNPSAESGFPIAMRCPGCRQKGTFSPLHNVSDVRTDNLLLGQRVCPDPSCRTHVFTAFELGDDSLITYPPEKIDFDPQGIPRKILNTFEESLSCHAAGLHVAAAIMVRRTLEELCEDKMATGENLKKRIESLRSSVVLPNSLLEALDALRLLGNDAAHIEAKTYTTVGANEIDIALELTKEILKAVYQLDGLVARLNALKKP